ncbi:MAG: cobalt ABC transporter permease, partial [Chloroflexi bacterium]|nr:cobalt ABC transporter permease [Chloroflexota bacterium]
GHSGVFWMALIVVAGGIVPKPGALTLVGLTSAILASFLGLGDQGPIETFLSYLALGAAAYVTATFLRTVEHPVTATLVGLVGNSAKMLVKLVVNVVMGIPAGFVAFGLLYSFITNAIAGAIGGFLGWLVLVALRRAGFFAYLEEKR